MTSRRHTWVVIFGALAGACQYQAREIGALDADGDADPFAGDPIVELDFDGIDWIDLPDAGGPGRTWYPGLVYDTARKSVVLYGGGGVSEPPRAELWELRGETWTLLQEGCPPGPVLAAAMVYDTWRKRVLIFGGSRTWPTPDPVGTLWSYANGTWTPLHENAAVAPSPRWAMAAGFDETRGVFVIYGGQTADVDGLSELWELHPDGWVGPIAVPSGPGPRGFAAGAYSRRLMATLVYGGGFPRRDDLWAWSGSSWSLLCTTCTGVARSHASVVHLPGGPLLLLGGWTGAEELAGTLSFDGDQFTPLLSNPSARDSMGVAYDPLNQRLVVFGGNGEGCLGGGDCEQTLFLTIPEG